MRVVYIQYASDPMIWFSPDLALIRPDWLKGERGPDVSPHLQWYPIATFLQIAFDLTMATAVPMGYGHNYSPSSYIDAWIAVTQPKGWTPRKIARLRKIKGLHLNDLWSQKSAESPFEKGDLQAVRQL